MCIVHLKQPQTGQQILLFKTRGHAGVSVMCLQHDVLICPAWKVQNIDASVPHLISWSVL